MTGTAFESEIREQPEALARTLREGREAVLALGARVRETMPGWVTIAARGTSDNAARYAQYVLGANDRLAVALAAPSLFTVFASPPRLVGSLVIGISQSGRSPDIVAVVEEGRRQGALTAAITNEPGSALASAAEHVLALHAGVERAVAATKTYTTQLMTIAMLSAAISGDEARWKAIEAVPDAVARRIEREAPRAASIAQGCKDAARFLVLGRGFDFSTAFEVALKIKETSYVLTEPYSFADFRHGPMALLEPGFPVLLVEGGPDDDVASIRALLAERGAQMIAIDRPTDLPGWLAPIETVVAGQLFALALARARGSDPDRPRGLSKVTETR